MKLILLSILLGCATSSIAQFQVKGRILENEKEGIPYATIALHSSTDSSLVKGSVSDTEGNFQIDGIPKGSYLINIQSVGFEKKWTKIFSLDNDNTVQDLKTFRLEPSTEILKELVVKGQRGLVEHKGDRMILNVENSVIAKGNKVEDLLKYAPLVTVSTNGIKVGNKGNVLILMDGRQLSESSLLNFLQNFSAEEIIKIEVQPNPSAKYDASYGAVINIITKKSLSVGLNGRLSMIYSQGKMGRLYPDATVNYRSQKWNFFSSVSGKIENYLEDQTLERYFPGGGMTNDLRVIFTTKGISTFNGIDFSPNKNHAFGLRFNSGTSKAPYKTQALTEFTSGRNHIDSLLYIEKLRTGKAQTYDINLYYTGKIDSLGKEISVSVTKSFLTKSNIQDLTYQRRDSNGNPIDKSSLVRISNPGNQQSLIAQTDLTLPSKIGRWEFGLRYMSIGNKNRLTQENEVEGLYLTDSAFSSYGIYNERGFAGYNAYRNELKHGWSVQAGLRFEHTSQKLASSDLTRTYSGIFPSMGLSKSFENKSSLNVTYSRKISRPALSNLVPSRSLMDPYSVLESNPRLKPAFASTLNLNFSMGDISVYANYTHTRNMISDVMFADLDTKIYTQSMDNLGSVNDMYTGVNWGKEVRKGWQSNSSLTISATQTNSQIGNVPGVKLSGAGFSLNSTHIFSLWDGYKAELFLIYNSPNRYTIWKNRALYWATISLTKTISKDYTFKLSIQDIFRTQTTTLLTEYGPINVSSRYYSDNQRIRLSMSYNFGKKSVKGAKYKSLGNEEEKNRMSGQ